MAVEAADGVAADGVAAADGAAVAWEAHADPHAGGTGMKLEKVMLVDDDADIRTIGEISLSKVGGWLVVLADSGTDALAKVSRERPDAILLDVMMPGMDGPTTFERLRDLPATRTTPIIFMTAKVQKLEVERYLALGAAGVISKPFDPMTLHKEVRRLLGAA